MGGIMTWEEIRDKYGPQVDLDVSELSCPRCGFQDCRIEQMPNPAGWMSRIGKARCEHCRARFQIQAIDEDE
jgi:hypothetical protein